MTCIFDRWPESPVPTELIETRKPETMTKTLTPFQNWWADLVEGFDPESVEVEELAKLAFEAGIQAVADMLDKRTDEYANAFDYDDLAKSEYYSLLRQTSYLVKAMLPAAQKRRAAKQLLTCTCPSGDGSLRWPCPEHPPAVPGWVLQFLTDVTTAAGLLYYGKTDKGLAKRIGDDSNRLRNCLASAKGE